MGKKKTIHIKVDGIEGLVKVKENSRRHKRLKNPSNTVRQRRAHR